MTAALLNPPAWHTQAACMTTTDPDAWFPVGKGEAEARTAKRICALCPVRRDCLEHALSRSEPHGVWGGMTEQERRKLNRTPKEQAA